MAVWRFAPAGELPLIDLSYTSLPPMGKDAPWSRPQALIYRQHAARSLSMSPDDEKLMRLVEIRKTNFFDGVPCAPAAVLASALVDLGERISDLRPINTALKLRDITVGSFPPVCAADRAFFHIADAKLESMLRRLEHYET